MGSKWVEQRVVLMVESLVDWMEGLWGLLKGILLV